MSTPWKPTMSTPSVNPSNVLLESPSPQVTPSDTPSSNTAATPLGTPQAPGACSPNRPPRTRWERPALAVLLLATAVLYLWDLSASGWANSFYSAAAQAGSKSWSAFLYGASDAAGSITVDKPPASLWIMALSVRVFGLSSWSIIAPQALMGVATVATLYTSVRRRFSPEAALLAGAILALTPVAALMFRYNNPDALLVLLLTLAAYATLRAVEDGRTRWMLLAGTLVGFAFLTKQLQAFLVLPGLAAAYLIAAPVSWRRRIRDGLLAVGAMVLAAGWWVALVQLVPASKRPYIGGSQTNSFLELTFGYNGLGPPHRLRNRRCLAWPWRRRRRWLWLLLAIGYRSDVRHRGGRADRLVDPRRPPARRRSPVAAPTRGAHRRGPAALIVWVSWLVVTGLTFSLMAGVFHEYYTVALAPAIAALVGIGASLVWQRRARLWSLAVLAVVTLATSGWAFVLLGRSADWLPWLRWVVLAAGLLGAVGLLAGHRVRARALTASAVTAILAGLVGPTAYTLQTVTTTHTGGIVTAGPTVAGGMGGMPGDMPGGARGATGAMPGDTGGMPGTPPTGGGAAFSGIPGGPGGTGGNGSKVGKKITTLLLNDADSYTWVAAAVSSINAAGYQLATQKSVMPIGGFTGSDPSPTLAQFKAKVAAGNIHYFIGAEQMGRASGGLTSSSKISAWVKATFTAQTVDGVTVYDLTQPAAMATNT